MAKTSITDYSFIKEKDLERLKNLMKKNKRSRSLQDLTEFAYEVTIRYLDAANDKDFYMLFNIKK
jgi:hypothetical protein